jgi:hypothetical protein
MPIDYTTPTVSPPTASDTLEDYTGEPGLPVIPAGNAITPPAAASEPDAPTVFDSLGSFSQDALKSPGRWDADMIQQGLGMIRENSAIAQEDQMATLDERMAMRGAVGSSIEADSTVDLLGQLNRSRQEQEYGLLTQAANANASDQASAANIASTTADLEQRLEQMRIDAAFRGEAFDIDRERINIQNEQFRSQMTESQKQFQAQMDEAQASRLQELGLSQQDFDQRALKLQQDAQQAGRSMDLQEARDSAEVSYRLEALQQDAELRGEEFDIERTRLSLQGEQFDREIGLKATEIANRADLEGRKMTLEEAKLEAENRWEIERLGEARSARLQDAGIKGRDLDLRSEALAKQYNLSDKELARDYAELDLRRESMLQDLGIDKEKLSLEAKRIQEDSRLRGEEMTSRQAMQQAELESRSTMLEQEIMAAQEEWMASLSSEERMQQEDLSSRMALAKEKILADAAAQDKSLTSAEAAQQAELQARREMAAEQIQADADAQGKTISAEELAQQADIKARAVLEANRIASEEGRQTSAITAEAALEKAKAQAQSNMQADRLKVEREMFDAQAKARSKEFTSQNKLDRDKYNTSKAQIQSEFADRTAQRLHEMGLREGTDARQAKEAQLNRVHESTLQTMLKDGRITVEKMREDAEYAWRAARNTMEKGLAEKEEALKKTGMSDEKAKWQAANLLEKSQRTADREAQTKTDSDRTAMQQLAALLGFEADIFGSQSRADSISENPSPNPPPESATVIAQLLKLLAGMRGTS